MDRTRARPRDARALGRERPRSLEPELVPLSETRARRALALMDKYHDVPMDIVDALLVVVGEERGVREVLTLDRRGLQAYRANGRERFHVVP